MLNAQTIGAYSPLSFLVGGGAAAYLSARTPSLGLDQTGGKKGTRHRDDVWTMKYLPRFRWDMLSEQVGECCLCCSRFRASFLGVQTES